MNLYAILTYNYHSYYLSFLILLIPFRLFHSVISVLGPNGLSFSVGKRAQEPTIWPNVTSRYSSSLHSPPSWTRLNIDNSFIPIPFTNIFGLINFSPPSFPNKKLETQLLPDNYSSTTIGLDLVCQLPNRTLERRMDNGSRWLEMDSTWTLVRLNKLFTFFSFSLFLIIFPLPVADAYSGQGTPSIDLGTHLNRNEGLGASYRFAVGASKGYVYKSRVSPGSYRGNTGNAGSLGTFNFNQTISILHTITYSIYFQVSRSVVRRLTAQEHAQLSESKTICTQCLREENLSSLFWSTSSNNIWASYR